MTILDLVEHPVPCATGTPKKAKQVTSPSEEKEAAALTTQFLLTAVLLSETASDAGSSIHCQHGISSLDSPGGDDVSDCGSKDAGTSAGQLDFCPIVHDHCYTTAEKVTVTVAEPTVSASAAPLTDSGSSLDESLQNLFGESQSVSRSLSLGLIGLLQCQFPTAAVARIPAWCGGRRN